MLKKKLIEYFSDLFYWSKIFHAEYHENKIAGNNQTYYKIYFKKIIFFGLHTEFKACP